METPVVRSRGRPRKRKREETQIEGDSKGYIKDVVENKNVPDDVQNTTGNFRKRGRPPKKKPVEIKGQAMVGRYVLKEFDGSGIFLGKIVSYDTGLYRVDYEDGDFEDLDSGELRVYLIADERGQFVGELLERKIKLDENLAKRTSLKYKDKPKKEELVGEFGKGYVAKPIDKAGEGDAGNVQSDMGNVEVRPLAELSNVEVEGSEVDDDDDDADSSSDSCEYGQGWEMRSETETPAFPPPELPPSSGTIGVPEEYVSNLFSVYGFLRSFSVRLFLSPFTLDDLVGCLNCTVPNTLLDAIHVALLRAMRRHLETLASDGTELASKCLRCTDWGLLDNLTWPVYLVHYLMVMGRLNGDDWKGFYIDVLDKDYCTLSVGTKLMVLQILCDDALDTEEIRAEIDMREESEVGVDSEGITIEHGPRKVYPRYPKNFAGKVSENMNINAESSGQFTSHSLTVKGNDLSGNDANVDEDGNGDECRLCGMDGVLLCCDGCPSAYHPRCIGVSKLSIPEGEWFCPECTISRIGPPLTVGTSLRGAAVFGVDSYAQLFLGTCNHLLVLKVSVKVSPFVRYYNRNDIPKVVSALCSSPHYAASYLGICWGLLKYWELPQDVLPPLTNNYLSLALINKDANVLPAQLHPFGENKSEEVVMENCCSSIGESIVDNESVSGTVKLVLMPHSADVSFGVPIKTGPTGMPREGGATMNQNLTSKPSEHAKVPCSTQGLVDRSSVTGIASYSSGISSCNSAGRRNGICLPDNIFAHGKQDCYRFGGRTNQKSKDTCLYMGSFFKPLAYINQYMHGDYAASAAANFAVLSSDESRASEINASDPRKVMSANVGLQGKAFSSVAVRFFWPSTEKKLIEVPRERCSWCLHCKAPISSKKACLLNQAALNATRAAMKFVLGLRLAKSVESGLYGIAAYTLYMEESLHGLILGPFQSASYRQEWRRKVEQASDCCDMKSLLLELEENLCTIAFSSEWTKLVDNWMDEPSVPQNACPTGTAQKRGPGRRRKHFASTEATVEDSSDGASYVSWWRGGRLAKLVFQRGTLPCSVLRKAARQGGSRRIPGISYADGPGVPKRSRQSIWRAAVEMARNMSQLALQVRYLDHHIKWSDLVRPEQNVQDAKGPETDLFAFRNAHICDKKVVDNKIIYGVTFGHQKHISSRLMKSAIEKEEIQDGRDKYWFSETRVPLYLIKEYEEKTEKSCMPSLDKPVPLSKLQKRQLKASRKDIFHYLARKRDNLYTCLCASCQQDVLLGVAVKCSACEGYCHNSCTTSSTVLTNEDFEFITTCKQCAHGKAVTQTNSTVESPTSPLAMQGQEYQNSAPVTKSVRLRSTIQQYQNSAVVAKSLRTKSNNQQSPSVGAVEAVSDKKPVSSDSNSKKSLKKDRQCHWGLIWKKKNTDDGSDFRLKNVLFGGNPSGGSTLRPSCYLCHKPYNHDLMYIHCETCQNWYHADALQLDESKLSNLIGFKCCRCRRIKSPVCPYADSNLKKTEVKKLRIRGPKEEGVGANSVSVSISEQTESSVPSTPMSPMEEDIYIPVDDPLLFSVSEAEHLPEPKTEEDFEWNNPPGPLPQKLPVRRHTKNEKADEGFAWNDPSLVQLPMSIDAKNVDDPHVQWNVSNGGLEDGTMFDYDNLNYESAEYEPQTYFSFTELLEADDGEQMGGVDAPEAAWQNLPCENPHSGFMEHCEMGSSNEHMTTASLEPVTYAQCSMCSETALPPDLWCHNCGLQIHSHCSPWEGASQGEAWSCGNCKQWR